MQHALEINRDHLPSIHLHCCLSFTTSLAYCLINPLTYKWFAIHPHISPLTDFYQGCGSKYNINSDLNPDRQAISIRIRIQNFLSIIDSNSNPHPWFLFLKSKELNCFQTLERSYLLKINGKVVERPQHMLMRVSVGIHGEDIEAAIETYNYLSEKWFTHASPTLFNAATRRPQLSR